MALPTLIRDNPGAVLGPESEAEFGAELPYLLKVLAAGTPLSIQAHPNMTQAREGFARENAAGVPLSAPHRSYKDPFHKPELLCALGDFEALSGFRPVPATLALLQRLNVAELSKVEAALAAQPNGDGLRAVFTEVMGASKAEQQRLVEAAVRGAARAAEQDGGFAEARWAVKLAELYPGDPGVIVALLMNHLVMREGEAIFMQPCVLHAYLSGLGIEIMAGSDNVLRGGLTPKHVDLPELLRVLDFTPTEVKLTPAKALDAHEHVYEMPVRELRLSRIELGAGETWTGKCHAAEILLAARGAGTATSSTGEVALAAGSSAFVPFSAGTYTVSGGPLTLFRATTAL
jgi:mannose-6-phosphate isomerase